MVHSATAVSLSNQAIEWDSQVKKPKLDTTYASTSKTQIKKDIQKDQQYGAWGSTFKNKNNFANMHCC
ncbi:unnamed protein product [Acanthoscelides obtectus]|uniref:Uncharacterized protein n=1 Tax=Acanthoscelides obtectus TaxID=200917 RepID=A0A9P0KQ02_ACAOB|nr:unnamed protein product [Acanthoscelides obtectus]CAK1670300.1 hypothetical protein AOBTE_LOCUS27542 [Acanthoscelides obtectus]